MTEGATTDAPPAGGCRTIGASAFCAIVVCLGVGLFALPIPPTEQVKWLAEAAEANGQIAIIGPSTIDVVSQCDSDKRTVVEMLRDTVGKKVSDLSSGQEQISDAINLAAAAGNSQSITDVVLAIAFSQVDEWTTPPYRMIAAFKATNPDLDVFSAANAQDLLAGLSSATPRIQQAYEFEGKKYPPYPIISAREFSREKKLAGCPEVVTHDPEFMKSYYWWTHVQPTENTALYPLVASLDRTLARKGRKLHIVLLPTNYDLIAKLDATWPAAIRKKEAKLVDGLRSQGLKVTDLSGEFRESEFITPWCGCIHLSAAGRAHLVRAIAADIAAPDTTLRARNER